MMKTKLTDVIKLNTVVNGVEVIEHLMSDFRIVIEWNDRVILIDDPSLSFKSARYFYSWADSKAEENGVVEEYRVERWNEESKSWRPIQVVDKKKT